MIRGDQVREWAGELGFIACGITTPAPSERAAFLDDWLARGYGGTMRYLNRQARKRKDPRLIDPEAKSVVVVLDNYYHRMDPPAATAPEGATPLRIAKYAHGADYHDAIGRRLDLLADRLRAGGAAHTRVYADAGPVPERELAARAGLGWIGKNAMLIRPGTGSFFFIGSIFTDLELEPDAPFEGDHCGSCTRCLDACPTGAFVAPRVLDATRCISYLTIEQKGPIPDDLEPHLDGWAFGCDVCNDVCPWNVKFAEETSVPDYLPRSGPPITGDTFERLDEAQFDERFGGTPFARPGLAGMRRNARAAAASRRGFAGKADTA
ncbi:MAG TPA: tRNA epoxyqueuosine(34) reductase QueG [Gemmatimonadales bacterium]|nr:tRNA epoxyqueuosine(34) reductase QueG [Gemmatimonadales bacterium]